MNRDFSKLIADYDSKFITAPATSKRWQLYVSDYSAISELATKTADTEGGGISRSCLTL